jgi:hypothetical protein
MADHSHRGAKIGPRVALVVSQAIVATHKALLGTKHKLAMLIFRAISDEISEEVDHTLGPILTDMKARYDDGGPMASFLDFMATGHGQWKAIVGAGVSTSGLLSAIAMIMNNELFPLVYDAIATNPHLIPDQGTLATMAAQGIRSVGEAEDGIARNGYDTGWAGSMIESERQYPGLPDALDMRRRGLIDDSTLRLYLERGGTPPDQIDAVVGLLANPLSPADAALAVLRGIISQDQANSIAAAWGVSADDLNVLVGNTGEPPGLMQLLEMFRRKFIDQPTLERGIRQSRVRDEWIPAVEQLRYAPMSIADAVNAVVQNYFTQAQAADIAEQNGLLPGQINTLIDVAGEPLSRGEMQQLYDRGLVSEDQVIQASRESRLKNKYNDLAFALHVKLLEPRMLSEAVQYGAITNADAVSIAQQHGYSAKDAATLVNLGTSRKLQTYKAKVIASLETMYEDGAIDSAPALDAMTGLGLTTDEANFVLEAADMKRSIKTMEQVISAVRSKYLSRHIVDSDVTGLLTTAGVPQPQIAYLLANWQIELQAVTRTLTEAQIVKAVKINLIPATPSDAAAWLAAIPAAQRPVVAPEDGETRLMNLGYSQEDADLLLQGA